MRELLSKISKLSYKRQYIYSEVDIPYNNALRSTEADEAAMALALEEPVC